VVNKKSAPQQEILEIKRIGEWGKLKYHHRLLCGHTEIRKRPSKTPKIACAWCVVASEKQRELRALTVVSPPVEYEQVWDFFDPILVDEIAIANLRSGVANSIGCSQESVEVVSSVDDDGNLRINYVTVILDYDQAVNLASSKKNTVDIP
jgi:hypothetical protein